MDFSSSEWCQFGGSWTRIQARINEIEADFPPEFYSLVMSCDEQAAEVRTARQTQRIGNGIEAQRQVLSIPGKKWGHLYEALREKELLTPKEAGILRIAMQIPAKVPSEKQCAVLIDILEKGRTEGIPIE